MHGLELPEPARGRDRGQHRHEQDAINLPAGPYVVTQGEIPITNPLIVTGESPRTTSITRSSATNFRLFNIASGAGGILISLVTLSNGRSTAAGGDILNASDLTLAYVRVTSGVAGTGGGGVATIGPGTLTVVSSLLDANSAGTLGGAIFLTASGAASSAGAVTVTNSTITGNAAVEGGPAGIAITGNSANGVELLQSTVARNGGFGLYAAGSGTFEAGGSIVAGNGVANCNVVPSDLGGNVEDLDTCGFRGNGSRHGVDPLLAAGTSNQGGFTDVLTIGAGSPAIDVVGPCLVPVDQRDVIRIASGGGPCDAGAFELTPGSGASVPVPAQQTPAPTPTPTPTPTATPVPQQAATGKPSGTVLIKLPGGKFAPLDASKPIPNGSEIDVTKGKITLTAILKPGGKPQTATFYDGIFKLKLGKTTTDLTLSQPLAPCKRGAGAAAKKPKTRKLWGDGSGSFRTRGQYSAATVRGTTWLVQDSCAGTLTRVKRGVVSVFDQVKHKTILLKAGKQYLARPTGAGRSRAA